MLIGNCKDETTLFSRIPSLFALTADELRQRIVAAGIPETLADRLLELYRRDYPSDSPSDLFFRFSTDRLARANAITQAERQLARGQRDVYMYYFAWDTPIADGAVRLKAFHTAELPLAMRLTRYPESELLSRQIASAWAGFARSGDPTPAGMAEWPRYDLTRRATMVFDIPSRVIDDPNRDERVLLRDLRLDRTP